MKILTKAHIDCLYGNLKALLHNQYSGRIRTIAGSAGFDLGLLPTGATDGGTAKKPILDGMDEQWRGWDHNQKTRVVQRLALALIAELERRNQNENPATRTAIDRINSEIRKCGFKFENGEFLLAEVNERI